MIIIGSCNILFNHYVTSENAYLIFILSTIIYTLASILLDAIVAIVGRLLPQKWVCKDSKIYKMNDKEKAFFNKLKIRKWKDHIPDLGSFTHLKKNKVEKPDDIEYLSKYIMEAKYGVIIHLLSAPLAFLIVLIDYKGYLINLSVGLPVAFVNMVLIIIPFFVLRYNLPKIEYLYKKQSLKINKNIDNNIES